MTFLFISFRILNEYSFSILISASRFLRKGVLTLKKKGIKHQKIIDAAVKVIAHNGYHQAQVAKIAREAGIADGTIYLYFKNKEDILISVFHEKMGLFIKKIEEKIEEKQTAKEKLLLLISLHFSQLQDNYDLALLTQLELRQTNKELRMKINTVLHPYLKLIDDILEEGIQQKLFVPDLNVKVARQMIFGTIDEIVTNWVIKDFKYNLTELAEPVLQLLLNGFCHKQTS